MNKELNNDNTKIKFISILLCIFLFSIPFDTFVVFENFSLVKFIAIVLIIVSLFYLKKRKVFYDKTIILVFALTLYTLMQLLFTEYNSDVISSFITFLMYSIIIFLIIQIDFNEKEKRMFIVSLCLMSLFCIILTFIFPYYYEGRLTIKFFDMRREDPNQFAGYLIPGLLFFFDRILNNKKGKIINSFFTILILYFLLLTGSRGALLAAIMGMSTIFIFDKNSKLMSIKTLKKIFILFFLGICVILIFKFLPSFLNERFNISYMLADGGTGRIEIWDFFISLFNKSSLFYKLFGYGSGCLSSLYYRIAHNTWIEVLIGSGFFGLIIFLKLMINIFKNLLKINNNLLMGLFFSILGLTMTLSLLAYKPLWIFIMISILLKNKSNNYMED